MEINRRNLGEVTIIDLKGLVDSSSTSELEKEIELVIAEGQHNIVLNLREVDSITSIGLVFLLKESDKLQREGGGLKLANPKNDIKQVFKINRLEKDVQIYDTEKVAVESFKQSSTPAEVRSHD